MSDPIKCPLCGSFLLPVGKKGAKMRCAKCHSVFDVSQLRQYYGMDTPNEFTPNAHEYETAHMHAVEVQKQRQRQQKEASHMISRSGGMLANPTQQPIPQRGAQSTPVKSGHSVGKLIVWLIFLFFFLFPMLFTAIPVLFEIFDDSGGSSTNTVSNYARNTNSNYNRNSNANANSNVATGALTLTDKMDMSATAQLGHDELYGDIVVVTYTWTNSYEYDEMFLSACVDSAYLDGREIYDASPADGVAGFKSDSRSAQVKPGKSSTTTMAYTLPDGARSGKLRVEVIAWKDFADADSDAEPFIQEFDLATLH